MEVAANHMNDQKQIALVTVFWGKWYTDTFLNFCLPSLLSKFNLPEFKNFFSVRFIISTNKKNQNIINNSDVVQLLKKIVKVDFLLFEDNLIPEEIRGEDAYKSSIKKTQLLIQEQNRVLGESFRSDIGLIYIHSDCIYSNHSLVFIANSIQRGVKLIYVPGFRVSYESFASSNYGKNFQPSNNKNDFLVKNSVKHFPQYHKSQYWCSDSLTKYPSAHFWKRKDLTLVRLFHERIPFFISSTYSHINIKNGIDSDFDNSLYLFARSRGDKIEHVTDSRQVFVASLVSDNYELLERWRAQGNLEKAISYKSNIKKKIFINTKIY